MLYTTKLPLRDYEIERLCNDNFIFCKINNKYAFNVYYRMVTNEDDQKEEKFMELHIVHLTHKYISSSFIYIDMNNSAYYVLDNVVFAISKVIRNEDNLFINFKKDLKPKDNELSLNVRNEDETMFSDVTLRFDYEDNNLIYDIDKETDIKAMDFTSKFLQIAERSEHKE